MRGSVRARALLVNRLVDGFDRPVAAARVRLSDRNAETVDAEPVNLAGRLVAMLAKRSR